PLLADLAVELDRPRWEVVQDQIGRGGRSFQRADEEKDERRGGEGEGAEAHGAVVWTVGGGQVVTRWSGKDPPNAARVVVSPACGGQRPLHRGRSAEPRHARRRRGDRPAHARGRAIATPLRRRTPEPRRDPRAPWKGRRTRAGVGRDRGRGCLQEDS